MFTARIMIITDDYNDSIGLIKKIKSFDYCTSTFSIRSPEVFDNIIIPPDLIIIDLNSDLNDIKKVFEVLSKFDVPLIYLRNNIDEHIFECTNKPYLCLEKPFNDKELKYAIELLIYHEKRNESLNSDDIKFKSLYDGVPIAYQSLDVNGNIKNVNAIWLHKLRYKRDDVIGNWFGNFLAPEFVKKFKENFSKFKADGEIYGVNFEMIRGDNTKISVLFDGKIGYDENGNFKETHCIFQDITEQKNIEKALKESEQYYKTIFENNGTATVIVDEDSIVSLMNTEFETLYGYKKGDIEGKKKWTEFVADENIPMMREYHNKRRLSPEKVPRNYEFNLKDNNGNLRNIYTTIATIPGTRKTLVSLQDITDRKNTEKRLKTSLKDKDVLLREIHHRVKNNLQIISSLLNLQSRYIDDENTLNVFAESQNRVRSMALIHEKLYKSRSMSKIDFGDYINDLTENLLYNYHIDPSRIQIKTEIDDIFFDVDTAIPCGLIINELITNCLKHAFPENHKGSIGIELFKREEDFELNINDTGVGFPDHIDFENTESLGMQIVNNLVNQVDGTIGLNNQNGTSFNIVFKELEYKRRL